MPERSPRRSILLEARAQSDGPERAVHVRIAEDAGRIYLDLADDRWRAVEIGPDGWQERLLDLDRSIGSAAAADAKGACEATSVEPNKHLFPAGPFGRRRRDPRARRRLTIAGLIVISYAFA